MDFMDCSYAFEELIKAVSLGYIPPKVEKIIRKLIFCDKMVPSMGNKYAFEEFLSKNKKGLYCVIDVNSFKKINDDYGHQKGDEVIIQVGEALHLTALKYFQRAKHRMKIFRVGGDEFVVYLEHPYNHQILFEELYSCLQTISFKETMPNVTVSLGCGLNYSQADAYLLKAKMKKKTYVDTFSQTPTIFLGEVTKENQVEWINGCVFV